MPYFWRPYYTKQFSNINKCTACLRHHTHARVLLGAIWDDLHMVTINVVTEEIVQVSFGPLTSENIQAAISLWKTRTQSQINQQTWTLQKLHQFTTQNIWPCNTSSLCALHVVTTGTDRVEEHTVSDPRLDVLRAGVTRVFSEQTPAASLTVIRVQPAELRFCRPAVIHAAITCQNPSPKRVDHVFLGVHAHLDENVKPLVSH